MVRAITVFVLLAYGRTALAAPLVELDPGAFAPGTELTRAWDGVTLKGDGFTPVAFQRNAEITIIGKKLGLGQGCCWTAQDRFRVSFADPVRVFAMDLFSGHPNRGWRGSARISALGSSGEVLRIADSGDLNAQFGSIAFRLVVALGRAAIHTVILEENTLDGFSGVEVRRIIYEAPEPTAALLVVFISATLLLVNSRE